MCVRNRPGNGGGGAARHSFVQPEILRKDPSVGEYAMHGPLILQHARRDGVGSLSTANETMVLIGMFRHVAPFSCLLFADIGEAYLVLFRVATLSGWSDVTRRCVASRGPHLAPRTCGPNYPCLLAPCNLMLMPSVPQSMSSA